MQKKTLLFICLSFFIFHFSLLKAQNDWLWARYGRGIGIGNSVTIDKDGNCFLTGVFQTYYGHGPNDMVFGSDTLVNNNPFGNLFDAFLAKYDKDGNLLWVKQSTGHNNSTTINGYVTSTDGAGNIYMTANFTDTIIFGTYLLHDDGWYSNNTFLVKYDPNGNVLWAKQSNVPTGDTSLVYSNSVSTDKSGNSYVTGGFFDTAIFGIDTLFHGGSSGNSFLVKYDKNGNVVWAKETRSPSSYSGAGAQNGTLDLFGNFYITGNLSDTVYFGTDTAISPIFTGSNFFLAKYDSNGNVRWVRQAEIPSSACSVGGYALALSTDNRSNVYVTGGFTDTIAFGTDTLIANSSNYSNIFVVKYDSSGNEKWAIQSKTPQKYEASTWSISTDTMGHVYVCGSEMYVKNPQFIIGKDTLKTTDTSIYDYPTFLLKFDTSGNLLCGNIFPYGGLYFPGIASDYSGNYVYMASTLFTEAVFGKDTIDPWTPKVNGFPLDGLPIIARWKECDSSILTTVIPKEKSKEGVGVFPNPSNGKFNLVVSGHLDSYRESVGSEMQVDVYNVLGQRVYSTPNLLPPAGGSVSFTFQMNLSAQPNGVYFYRVVTENGGLVGEGEGGN